MSCENNSNRASSAAGPSGGITSTNSKSAFAAGVQQSGKALTAGAEYISQSRAYRVGRVIGKIYAAPLKATQKIGQGSIRMIGKGAIGGIRLGLGGVKNTVLFTAGLASASPIVEEAAGIARAAQAAAPYVSKVASAGQAARRQVGDSGAETFTPSEG